MEVLIAILGLCWCLLGLAIWVIAERVDWIQDQMWEIRTMARKEQG